MGFHLDVSFLPISRGPALYILLLFAFCLFLAADLERGRSSKKEPAFNLFCSFLDNLIGFQFELLILPISLGPALYGPCDLDRVIFGFFGFNLSVIHDVLVLVSSYWIGVHPLFDFMRPMSPRHRH